MQRSPGYEALRRHRWSVAECQYFVTISTRRPCGALTDAALADSVLRAALALVPENVWALRCVTIMPDHLHLFVRLGHAGSLSDAVRLLKGRTSPALRQAAARWQPGYYEHRLRCNEDTLPVFQYIFLNPYRAKLLDVTQRWHGFWCSPEDWSWFGELTNASVLFPQWLGEIGA